MTQEEKARAYDEALERLKGLIEGTREDRCTIVEEDIIDIFPELKESDDERIKKELIDAINGLWANDSIPMPFSLKRKDSWIAWLEKQAPKSKTALDKAIEDEVDAWVEKQDERKPINTFKAKDWYVSNIDGKIHNINTTIEEKAKMDAGFTNMMLGKKHPKFKPSDKITNGEDVYTIQYVDTETYWVEEHDCLEIPIEYQDQWKLVEENLKWTEEDESKVEDIIYFLNTAKTHYASTKALDDCVEWLKSLKQRMEE